MAMLSSQVSVASSWGSGSLELWKWRFNCCVAPRVCHRYFCITFATVVKCQVKILWDSEWIQNDSKHLVIQVSADV